MSTLKYLPCEHLFIGLREARRGAGRTKSVSSEGAYFQAFQLIAGARRCPSPRVVA